MHGADTGQVAGEQIRIPFVLMRGGTSKAVFLRGADLPPPGPERDAEILALFGSPDPRQIDGLGGADLLTSKLAIIDRPSRPDADLDYTFGQVSITDPVVDYDINCGNISAAVGAYGVDEGFVDGGAPSARVRIHNTNTGKILVAEVPTAGGRAAIAGDVAIDGVPGTGAGIALDYSATAGGSTGSLLPTGRTIDQLQVDGREVSVTILDIANLCVFFAAAAVGLTGTEGPDEFTDAHLDAVARIKAAAASLLGMSDDGLTPIPVAVSPPAPFVSFSSGEKVGEDEIDLLARVVGGRPPVLHKAYPGTVGATTAVAAAIPGTVVNAVARGGGDGKLTIGHPSGTMPVIGRVRSTQTGVEVDQAAYVRTARRLAEGSAFVMRAIG